MPATNSQRVWGMWSSKWAHCIIEA
jgi:hypothetical protein